MNADQRNDDDASSDEKPTGIEAWLSELCSGKHLTEKSRSVVSALGRQPRIASYSGASHLAQLADVNVATVTRTAQALGFTGWPSLQRELRQRFLSSLSNVELSESHEDESWSKPISSLRQDRDGLSIALRDIDGKRIHDISTEIARANRTFIVTAGSYVAVAYALAHNAKLAGYPVEVVGEGTALFNALARLEPGDMVFAIGFWRPYRDVITAARYARANGITVCVLTDSATGPLAHTADHVLIVTAEGVDFFPSLTIALALVQAVCVDLSSIDKDVTHASLERHSANLSMLHLVEKDT